MKLKTKTTETRRKRPRTQEERRSVAEAKLLDAAMTLVAERGLDRMTLADVGEAAGFSRGLPAHHFGSKIGLIQELSKETGRRLLRELFPKSAPEIGLEAVIQTIHRFLLMKDLRSVRVYLEFQKKASSLNSPYREAMLMFFNVAQGKLEHHIRTGQAQGVISAELDPARQAELLIASLRGLILQQLLTENAVDSTALADAFESSTRRHLGAR